VLVIPSLRLYNRALGSRVGITHEKS